MHPFAFATLVLVGIVFIIYSLEIKSTINFTFNMVNVTLFLASYTLIGEPCMSVLWLLVALFCMAYFVAFWPLFLLPAVSALGAPKKTMKPLHRTSAWIYIAAITLIPGSLMVVSVIQCILEII